MILILEYEGESDKSKKGILSDAENLKKKHERKGQQSKLCKNLQEFCEYMSSPNSKAEIKLHIMCHGNRTCVGNFNGGQLARLLWDSGLKKRANLKQITIHSCESGWEHTNPENNSWTPPMVWQAAAFFAAQGRNMIVKGSEGKTVTDSMGNNFVLKPGHDWDAKENITRTREEELLAEKCFPKGTCRPKYSTYNGMAPSLG